jgi:nicotinate-nucleotide adenylyltransferase
MSRKIVLFGGTFDPVHHGHLIVARALAERCGFPQVTFVPAARSPHKGPAAADAEHRLAMLRLATAGEAVFDVCQLELDRNGPSYTYDTLTELKRRHGPQTDLNLLIGADALQDLPLWHRASELLDLANVIVAYRPPWQERMEEAFAALEGRLPSAAVGRLRRSVVPSPLIDISSTQIRDRVREGKSIRFLVPETVRGYIEEQRLYVAPA